MQHLFAYSSLRAYNFKICLEINLFKKIVKNNEYTTKRKNILTFNKREKLHRLNEPNNEMINSLRENVIRIYDEHYMNCYVNNFMNERLKLKDYIDATVENVSSCEIWNGSKE